MSENKHRLSDPDDGSDASLGRLIQDLRTLPSIAAPDDFEYKLKQRIAAASLKPDPWWKRIPGFQSGGSRVPAFAYGAVVAVAALAFSIYVYQSRNLPDQIKSLPATEENIRQELPSNSPEQEAPVATPELRSTPDRTVKPAAPTSVPPSDNRAVRPAVQAPAPAAQKAEKVTNAPVMRGLFEESDEATADTLAKKDSAAVKATDGVKTPKSAKAKVRTPKRQH